MRKRTVPALCAALMCTCGLLGGCGTLAGNAPEQTESPAAETTVTTEPPAPENLLIV